jgi:integrase/recombinase XerC/integrase/recombinase XerD
METSRLPVQVKGGITREPSLEELITDFIRAQDVRESSRETYRKGLKKFLTWLRAQGITSPDRQTILDYKDALRESGLSSFSISAYIVVVRKFFTWLEATRGLPNIAKGIKGARRTKGFRKDPLTLPQVRELLASVDRRELRGIRDYALINLLTTTGLRTIEAVRASVEDVRQEGGEALLWIQGKGRDEKDEPALLPAETLKPLYEYLTARGPARPDAPLFASLSNRNGGERLTTRTLRRVIKERLRAIGIDSERLTAHSVRHTCITLALQAGATIQEAQVLARHANINTTLIYAHNIDRIKQAPERKVAALLSGNMDNTSNTGNTILPINERAPL